jgi:predicted AAA+ superfamily ATPase
VSLADHGFASALLGSTVQRESGLVWYALSLDRDSGILHALTGISAFDDLLGHHAVGASWEGFVIEEVYKLLWLYDAYFWGTHAGAELDMMFVYHGKNFGLEIKFTEAPKTTKSMHIAIEDLGLKHLWIIHPGPYTYPMTETISALSITDLLTLPDLLDAQIRP